MKIDLHTHSTFSDGTDTPTQLMHEAVLSGLDVIALTDHDTTAGWSEATNARRGMLQLVLGAEISCITEEGKSVHIGALLFDENYQPLKKALELSRDDRIPRMEKMVALLQADGFQISMADVEARRPDGATLGRPHLADALVAKGIVPNRDVAFEKYLNNNSKYYVSHLAPTPIEAIKLIKAAGGVSVVAHAFSSFRGELLNSDFFEKWVAAGLNAIEVDHRDHNPSDREILRNIAVDLALCITGSSDYHGDGKLNLLGENSTTPEEWERLESLANARRVINV